MIQAAEREVPGAAGVQGERGGRVTHDSVRVSGPVGLDGNALRPLRGRVTWFRADRPRREERPAYPVGEQEFGTVVVRRDEHGLFVDRAACECGCAQAAYERPNGYLVGDHERRRVAPPAPPLRRSDIIIGPTKRQRLEVDDE